MDWIDISEIPKKHGVKYLGYCDGDIFIFHWDAWSKKFHRHETLSDTRWHMQPVKFMNLPNKPGKDGE